MTTIIFTQDFATRKKGEVWTCDGMLAAQLIGEDKVAKVYTGEEQASTDTEASAKDTSAKSNPKKKGKQ